MRYVFAMNPAAGRGRLQNILAEKINSFFSNKNYRYEIFFSKHKGDIQNYSNTLAKTGEDITIFACGGEGTCFEVLNGTYGYDNISIGVYRAALQTIF